MSEDEFWDMLPREFDNRLIAFQKWTTHDDERFWSGHLFVVNHLRDLMNMQRKKGSPRIKPITLEKLKAMSKKATAEQEDPEKMRKEFEELCAHIDRVRKNGVRRVLSVQKV